MCGHGDVGRRLSIEGIRDEISWVWYPTTYKAFLAMLIDLGNPEACFFSGIKVVFMESRGHNDLWCATEGGHDVTAYLYAILLYRTWRCRRRRHRETVHEAGRGRRQYDVEMAEQRGVSAFAREGHACDPLLELAHLRVNRCRLRHRCAAIRRAQETAAAAAWIKDGFKFLCFVAKTVGSTTKW
jgi:hypothetical protein